MAKVRFKKITSPPPEQPVFEDEGLMEARRRQRTGIRDVIWVAIGLGLILVVGMIYEATQGGDRRAARVKAEQAARTAPVVPYNAYQTPNRYPTVEEMQADAVVREARELAAANAAANATDPMLNRQLPQPVAPAYSPTPASPFGPQPQNPAGAEAAPSSHAPQAPTPSGPPR